MPERNPQDERTRNVPEPQIGGLDHASYGGSWTLWLVVFFVALIVAFWFAGWGFGGYGGWWWGHKTIAIVKPDMQLSGSGVAIIDSPDPSVYVGQPFQLNNVPIQQKVNDQAMWIGNLSSGPMLIVFGGNESTANQNAAGNENTASTKSHTKSGKKHATEEANANQSNSAASDNGNEGARNNEGANNNNEGASNDVAASGAGISPGDRVNVTGTVAKAPPADTAKSQWGLSDAGVARLEKQHAYIEVSQVRKLQSANH